MRKPIKTGHLEYNGSGEICFADDSRGSLRIYEKPGVHCAVGADVAEGIEEDHSAAIVLNCETNATMAAFNSGKIDPDQFAVFLEMLGLYYRKPLIGVERNSVGFSVVSDLIKKYPTKYIYFHMRLDEKTKIKTKKFGWWTSEHTRHLMLGYLKQEIREESTDLKDKLLIGQCMRFVNIDGKPQAAEGEHDDLVFARAIAGMMKRHRPVRFAPIVEPAPVPKMY